MLLIAILVPSWQLLIKGIEIVKTKEVKMIWDRSHVALSKQGL